MKHLEVLDGTAYQVTVKGDSDQEGYLITLEKPGHTDDPFLNGELELVGERYVHSVSNQASLENIVREMMELDNHRETFIGVYSGKVSIGSDD